MEKINLNNNWKLKEEELSFGPEKMPEVSRRQEGWMEEISVPCDIHTPLIEQGFIKEPIDTEECFSSEWIEEKSWWFKNTFSVDEKILGEDIVELTLESLDSEADIFLNDFHLGHHKSSHYPFSQDVKDKLVKGENILIIRLTSGLEHYCEKDMAGIKNFIFTEEEQSRGPRGDKRRVFVRKPQYVYGWDWGPRIATCGIVKDVYLKAHSKLIIRSVYVSTVKAMPDAELKFQVEIENLHPFSTYDSSIKIEIFDGDEKILIIPLEVLLRSGINFYEINTTIKDPKLWWPNGMGEQNLYEIRVSASLENRIVSYDPFKYGIRTLELDISKINNLERNFAFKINGVKTFCKGGDWIPADSIYARVTDEKYDHLLREAVEANFNMLRIWGGGIYERDIFYDKCDEYGILVWQDFMFACALYPDKFEWFKKEVENEMNYQTKRLRNHPCISLWCGNNENHWFFDVKFFGDSDPEYWGGIECYHQIAPLVVKNNCPNIPYWNSSPYGGTHPNGSDLGNNHHWMECTMNPDMEKRITPEEYDRITSKFISEYGYIGPCVKSSIIKYHSGNKVDKDGSIWNHHNNTFEKQTVPAGIKKHYKDPEKLDLDQYILYASLCQGLMLQYSLESMRFAKDCWGSLFWMYNDCWGEVGWSIIDYYLKRKPSYYFVKRAFAPLNFILREKEGIIKVMGVNDTEKNEKIGIEYGYISFDGKEKTIENTMVELKPHSKEIVLEFKKGKYDFTKGTCIVRPVPDRTGIGPKGLRTSVFKDLIIPRATIKVSNIKKDKNNIIFDMISNYFAHAVHFNIGDNILLSDEYFDLFPGEKRTIVIYDAAGRIKEGDIKPVGIYNK
ncbi:sugar-binding domain-containing protein [Actinomycetota bacterium]